jgi:uncharacterized coiled-coil protein SlyX
VWIAGAYTEQVFNYVNAHNNQHYADFSDLLRTTFDESVSSFENETIDLLHIDGLHTYEAVSHDFHTWLPKLSPGAVVLFHDTNVIKPDFGVRQFWQELQEQYPNHIEFTHSHGLGVLQLNNAPEAKKLSWLESSMPFQKKLKDYFEHLGSSQMDRYDLNMLQSQYSDLNAKIITINKTLAERDKQIEQLNRALVERNEEVMRLNQELNRSMMHKLTRLLRNSSDGNLR